MKKFFKNNIVYFISFIISFVLIILMFRFNNAGFGLEKNILYSDLFSEYFPFLSWLRRAIIDNSLLYSFSNGLGDSMIGVITYYLLSPFNLLALLFSNKELINLPFLIILIKLSLASSTMCFYLKKHFNADNKVILFGLLYSLCGYSINYYFNILWLDSFYMFPLVIYSLERLIRDNKRTLYIICLSYTIMVSYYIGYIICIFLCAYFIYYCFINYDIKKDKDELKHIIIRFIICSLLSGIISSIVIIPSFYDLKNGYRMNSLNEGFNISSSVFEIFGRLFFASANNDNIMNYTLPSIYSGLIVIPLIYLFYKYGKAKEKIHSFILLAFMCLPFFIPFINKIWHGFNYPYYYNYRFSFIISFLLIVYAYKGFSFINKSKWYDYLIVGSLFVIISSILIIKNYDWLSPEVIIFNLLFMIFYLLLMFLIKKRSFNKILVVILNLICFLELFYNGYFIFNTYNFENNTRHYDNYNSLSKMINNVLPGDNDFYRIEKTFYNRLDDNYIYNNYGMNTFSSTIKMNVIDFIKKLGFKAGNNDLFFTAASSPIFNSLFNLKYILVIGNIENNVYSKIYDIKDTNNYCDDTKCYTVNTYENNHPLGLGFMVSNDVKDYNSNNSFTDYDYQKYIFGLMIGKDSESITQIVDNENEYSLSNQGIYYLYVKLDSIDRDDKGYLLINNNIFSDLSTFSPSIYILPDDLYDKDIKISVEPYEGEFGLDTSKVYSFDANKFQNEISVLENNVLKIIEFKNDYIKGNIKSDASGVFFSSIPYDDGWDVFVDGKKVNKYKLFDTFIGFDLDDKEHTIEFKYHIVGFKTGLIVSFLGIIASIFYIVIFDKKKV